MLLLDFKMMRMLNTQFVIRRMLPCLCLVGLIAIFLLPRLRAEEADKESEERILKNLPKSVEEARGRARWMNEIIHGSLQVMHRDFFGDGDDESLALPSQSLDDVFEEMSRSWDVDIRWLGVNAMQGVDHRPKDRFEEAAAKALLEGAKEFEAVEGTQFRFAGAIKIHNQCLKCHVRNRRSLEERVAGLVIGFPMDLEK